MFKLNLPEAPLKFSNRNGKPTIWDFVRKKWLVLTPEEYIRQSFLHYLMQHLHYPASLLSVERGLEVLRLSKRTDIVVYDNAGQPHILVECKAPQIKISKHALQQTSIYNLAVKARYLCVTNGLEHVFFQIDYAQGSFKQIKELPMHASA